MRRQSTWCVSIFLLVVSAAPSRGQDAQAPAAQQEAMKKLDFLVGQWQGESWLELGPGQRRTAQGTETVQRKLNGLLLTIEGIHKRKVGDKVEESIVHEAFAVISYDEHAKRYRFQAYTGRGNYAEAETKVGDRSLEWSMRIPQGGEVRYTIRLNEKGQWFEIGEFSRDGKEWRKFFEMTLERVKES
jgi:hypothetical protein